jgi:hypothetical protein
VFSIGSGLYVRWKENIRFLAFHRVTDQIASDIVSGVSDGLPPDLRATVFVGIHRPYKGLIFPHGMRIGIQTEQYFDEAGKELWNYRHSGDFVRASLTRFDRVLDINRTNAPFYEKLPDEFRRRVTLGPHIFPDHVPDFSPGTTDRCLFFGALNERRKNIYAKYKEKYKIDILPNEIYGSNLYAELFRYKSILNIHFADGIYTEYPRLLNSVIAGKVLRSEKLSSDLIPAVDYMLLGDDQTKTDERRMFANIGEKMSSDSSFAKYVLRSV